MAWTDRLLPASFRGAAFKVDVAELAGGRRTVTHEYPLRDQPYVEDMGLRARRFTVEAYVVGAAYMAARDTLLAALEQEGAGDLVHPYHGSKQVICSGFRLRESREEGGMARFAIDFEEAKFTPIQPVATVDPSARVAAAADDGLLAAGEAFLDAYFIDGQPQFSLDSIGGMIRDASLLMSLVFAPAINGTQAAASMKSLLGGLYANAELLVRQPAEIVRRFQDIMTSLFGQSSSPAQGLQALLGAYAFTSGADPLPITATRQQEVANRAAVAGLFQRTAVIEAARTATHVYFESYDDAIAARDAITAKLDEQADTAPDAVFTALNQLRTELVRAVPGEANDLPRLVTYTPPETVPSLVLAHRLYGDIGHEADILARNRIRHPGFVVGHRPLEILTDE